MRYYTLRINRMLLEEQGMSHLIPFPQLFSEMIVAATVLHRSTNDFKIRAMSKSIEPS